MSAYTLHLEKFSGPLEKLLELVEGNELPITEISLARVTNDFLAYLTELQKQGEVPPETIADFIVIASRLILIKSRSLLPGLELSEEEERDIKELETRLELYKQLAPMFRALRKMYLSPERSASRPYFLDAPAFTGSAGGESFFFPSPGLTSEMLAQVTGKLLSVLAKFEHEAHVIRDTIVSIEEKIKDVVMRLAGKAMLRLKELAGTESRGDIIASFLAVLHLAREQRVLLEQESHFADIMVRNV